MKEGIEVSVIVPVYNVEKFIRQCLLSVERQTYRDYELIIIDDGSTDQSGAICDQYAQTHRNVTVIHQDNQGLSAARNNGVRIAKGDYISFIDSDDYVSPDYLTYLVDQIEKTGADIAIGKSIIVFEDNNRFPKLIMGSYEVFSTEEALIHMMYEKKYLGTAWGKIYKKELVVKHPFPEGALYEDLAVAYKIFGDAEYVSYGDAIIYFWRHRKNSITKQRISSKHLKSLEYAAEQIRYMQENYPNAVPAAKYKIAGKVVNLIPYIFTENDGGRSHFKQLQSALNQYYIEVIKDPEARKDVKIRCLAVHIGYIPARLLTRMVELIKPIRSKLLLRKIKANQR